MAQTKRKSEQLAEAVTRWAGSSSGFLTALAVIVVWAALGPVFGPRVHPWSHDGRI